MMDITYDYYRIFYYVAKYGSFSRAAEVLLRGQPNITKTINNLESQLGCKLFLRSNRGVTLTPEGEKLYHHAEIAFENLSKAELEIISKVNLDDGVISVATTEIGLYGSLLPALISFNRDYPRVKIKIANFNSPQALEAVKNGVADFAVVTLHEKADAIYRVQKIRDFKEPLCCQKGYMDGYEGDIFSRPYISINRNSYCEETMTGFEYSFAGLLCSRNMIDDGIKAVSAVREGKLLLSAFGLKFSNTVSSFKIDGKSVDFKFENGIIYFEETTISQNMEFII